MIYNVENNKFSEMILITLAVHSSLHGVFFEVSEVRPTKNLSSRPSFI
jgi:hypothetical protein